MDLSHTEGRWDRWGDDPTILGRVGDELARRGTHEAAAIAQLADLTDDLTAELKQSLPAQAIVRFVNTGGSATYADRRAAVRTFEMVSLRTTPPPLPRQPRQKGRRRPRHLSPIEQGLVRLVATDCDLHAVLVGAVEAGAHTSELGYTTTERFTRVDARWKVLCDAGGSIPSRFVTLPTWCADNVDPLIARTPNGGRVFTPVSPFDPPSRSSSRADLAASTGMMLRSLLDAAGFGWDHEVVAMSIGLHGESSGLSGATR